MAKQTTQRRRIRVGCAGWSIPREHAALFGAGDSLLSRYATRFDAVEINSSFYRPHQPKTYARWAASVPADFRFSVKLPQTLSHERALRGCGPLLGGFLEQVQPLGRKLGGFLLQLPPSLAFDARIAATFFALLRRRTDARVACEARHASWFTAHAVALLARHGITQVAVDPALMPEAGLPAGDRRWHYWRWHGAPRIYYSAYGEAALQSRVPIVRAHPARGETWIIFDNTAHGHAIADAASMQRLLHQ